MKRLALLTGISLLLVAGQAGAVETSGNVSIATDYAFRGISQTNENATIQGGIDLVADSGLYLGIWASNVNFDGSIELNFYAGYAGSFNEMVNYDLGILRYEYPDDEQVSAPLCDSAIDKRCESSF
ncbi:MAG: TorF family putative porin, partial [Pseudomonadales bacterium]